MDTNLHDIFIQEAEENLMLLEDMIISLEENPNNEDMINDAFRSIHSIKGGAGLAGFSVIKDFTHIVEDLFESIRSGKLKIKEELISVILESMDIMKAMVANIKDGYEADNNIETSSNITNIKAILNKEDTTEEDEPKEIQEIDKTTLSAFYLNLTFYPELFQTGIDPLMFISDLERIGNIIAITHSFNEHYEVAAYQPETLFLKWDIFLESSKSISDISDIFCFVADESEIEIINLSEHKDDSEFIETYKVNDKHILEYNLSGSSEEPVIERRSDDRRQGDRRQGDRRSASRSTASYIRVPTEKLEMIFNTVSELLISQARLSMLTEEYEDEIPDSFSTVADSLKNQNQLLQEQVTSLRMMNLGNTFDRFKRVVRDMASDMGKKIKLELSGQDTELDKNMIEKLNDPLKHLVRNCIDHGIETTEERLTLGKPPEGLLKLSAYLESGKVVIEVSDDGCGINKEKLLNKAIDRGLVPDDIKLTDSEILNLIFNPGLSTAEKITDISGRGVGMDVVKSSINDLHGSIDLYSEEGKGTTFKLNLPLTLAILDGMLISVGRERYIIPTLVILEIFRPEITDLKSISGGKELVLFRGNYIPIIRLHELFGIEEYKKDPVDGQVIVINSAGTKVAILVDSVLEQYQIVLKSLQRNFKKVEHISSATILGDGTVALIVDVPSIVKDKSYKNEQAL